jgi:hypothetical protein
MIGPLLNYYGGKHATSHRYPRPEFRTIIEPFAGSAGYASRYHDHDVILVEKYPRLAAVWRYLIGASEREILALPLLAPGETLDDHAWPCAEARDLVGWSVNTAITAPRMQLSVWAAAKQPGGSDAGRESGAWSGKRRAIFAKTVPKIRHWRIIEGDYSDAPDGPATWFIDPPYEVKGTHYPHGSEAIDFPALGEWCQSRQGQVIVCEQVGATWLPFVPFSASRSASTQHKGVSEAIWTRHADPLGALGMCADGAA